MLLKGVFGAQNFGFDLCWYWDIAKQLKPGSSVIKHFMLVIY